MPVKYCPFDGCHAKTEYTAKVPRCCSQCGQPFAAAFIQAPTEDTEAVAQVVRAKPVAVKMSSRNVALLRRPSAAPSINAEDQEDGSDVRVSSNIVQSLKEQMLASISVSDFGISKDIGPKITLGSVFANPDQFVGGQRSYEDQAPIENPTAE